MKFTIMLLFLSCGLFAQHEPNCGFKDEFARHIDNTEPFEIVIRQSNQCRYDTLLIIDLMIYVVPDRFILMDYDTRDTLIDTKWIFCNWEFLDSTDECNDGFVWFTNDSVWSVSYMIPYDYHFHTANPWGFYGMARIMYRTNKDFFILRVIPNQHAYTIGRFWVNCIDSYCYTEYDTIIYTDFTTPTPQYTYVYGKCCDTLYINEYVSDKVPDVFLPNIFSPNGDGINDIYLPRVKEYYVHNFIEFTVFNRWGAVLHRERNVKQLEGWDGYDNNPWVYVVLLVYEDYKGVVHRESSDITLIR